MAERGRAGGSSDADRALDDLEQVFKALAHPARRQILLGLHFRGGRMSSGAIAGRFSCAWPTVTRHLSILRAARLVRVEHSGRERTYVLDRERLEAVAGGWLAWFRREPVESPPKSEA